jgi:hypothetical protein
MKAVTQCAVFAAIIATLALAACASVPDPGPELAASTAEADAKPVLTGSHIPSNRTDKMLYRISSQDYKQNKDALPAPLRSQ